MLLFDYSTERKTQGILYKHIVKCSSPARIEAIIDHRVHDDISCTPRAGLSFAH